MAVEAIKPVVRDAVGYGLRALGLTRPDPRLYYAVTFHRVLPDEALGQYPLAELAVTPTAFRWFLTLFTRHFTCGTLAATFERYRAGQRPEKPFLAVTFDDGQLDNYVHARPELERAGVNASFFVPVEAVEGNEVLWHDRLAFAAATYWARDERAARASFQAIGVPSDQPAAGAVNAAVERAKALAPDERRAWVDRIEAAVGGPTRPAWDGMMTWDQLREMADEGHEIGSHSMSHQILTQLEGDALDYEVTKSRRVIEDRLQSPVRSFCYPNGDCNDSTVAAVAQAGYAQGVTTRWGPNATSQHPFTLTRCDIQTQHARSAKGSLSEARMLWRLSRYFPDPS